MSTPMPPTRSTISEFDLHLFNEGSHRRLHEVFGAQPDAQGTRFALWAPNAHAVEVIGSFGSGTAHSLKPVASSGVWCAWVEGATVGDTYHFRVHSRLGAVDKSDPFAAAACVSPSIDSIIADLTYTWTDAEWMASRGSRVAVDAPLSIYEVHLGSWGRSVAADRRFLRYDELADPLADHALAHGFTHVELMPIMEHPFYGSWGYQTTGYFAPTSRYGSPIDLMRMVDRMHQRGVGVILDWVPSHFPTDRHGLAQFDGTHLFEHADPRQGFHPDWESAIFNYGRAEVQSFLTSSAVCWLDRFHADGLRVDAVASMLYLDYSRREGEWIPNQFGGRENLEAISFMRRLNEVVYEEFPDTTTMAEESTSWPMVSRPTYVGGLGFGYKWDMGWMHDTLAYLSEDPVYRRWHHSELTFRSVYAASENFVLPLSHDEVVHGKGSLLAKMPGDLWQKFANLRLLYAMQWAQPGKKLLFMGCELASPTEWNHEATLDWSLHDAPMHEGVRLLVADLNRLYAAEPALHRGDSGSAGWRVIEGADADQSVYVFARLDPSGESRPVVIAFNATPVPRLGYRVGVPVGGAWTELLNTDSDLYGGSGMGNMGRVQADEIRWHTDEFSVMLALPPLGAVFLSPENWSPENLSPGNLSPGN
jgi:1,4-alpha-glucan branching enzyme